ncbi:MAG: membrane protein insertase YidC [candidate division Zixibacteria bacterium]|nr:membrane protein insertase YidC [candidate division Zixibacteria bacterium]
MDKKNLIVVVACVLLLVFWSKILEITGLYTPPPPAPAQTTLVDSTGAPIQSQPIAPASSSQAPADIASTQEMVVFDSTFETREIVVTTPKYVLKFTNRGGGINKILLRDYFYHDSGNVVLAESDHIVVPDFETSARGYRGSNKQFSTTATDFELSAGSSPRKISYVHDNGAGGQITKTYTIYPDKYDIGFEITVNGIETFGFERSYQVVWDITPNPTEKDISDDYDNYYRSVARMGGEFYEYDDYDNNKMDEYNESPVTEWAGLRTKYFSMLMIPQSRNGIGVMVKGTKREVIIQGDEVTRRALTTGVSMQMGNAGSITDSFLIYAGPIHYQNLKEYNLGLEDLTSMGWVIIKPFSIGIIWLLPKLYNLVPNYGFVVLIFALLIKLITFPLSRKQTAAMGKMKDLQPKMKKLQEKFKNDPKKLNKEMMKLYKDAGANPLSGCLPMLPQMPIFFALFTVFKTTIEFRGAHFIGYITDLSVADPYYILPIIMALSMFVQQKMTMTDPKHKMMVYMMPLLFGYLFHTFPVGLVLYWTGFNILALAETILVRKQQAKKDEQNPQVMDA